MMLLLRVAWKLEANRPDATAKRLDRIKMSPRVNLARRTGLLPSWGGSRGRDEISDFQGDELGPKK